MKTDMEQVTLEILAEELKCLLKDMKPEDDFEVILVAFDAETEQLYNQLIQSVAMK